MDKDFGILISEYQRGSREAAEIFYERFHRLVKKLSYCHNAAVDQEELENALWCRFFEMTKKFDAADAIRFPAYIKTCLQRYRWEYLRHERRIMKREGVDVESVDEPLYECNHNGLEEEEWAKLEKTLKLTARQKQVVTMIRQGYGSREIRDFLGISHQGLSKHINHLKTKIERNPEIFEFLSENRL